MTCGRAVWWQTLLGVYPDYALLNVLTVSGLNSSRLKYRSSLRLCTWALTPLRDHYTSVTSYPFSVCSTSNFEVIV